MLYPYPIVSDSLEQHLDWLYAPSTPATPGDLLPLIPDLLDDLPLHTHVAFKHPALGRTAGTIIHINGTYSTHYTIKPDDERLFCKTVHFSAIMEVL